MNLLLGKVVAWIEAAPLDPSVIILSDEDWQSLASQLPHDEQSGGFVTPYFYVCGKKVMRDSAYTAIEKASR